MDFWDSVANCRVSFKIYKKFVFFNKTGALDEYELVHSDATGETRFENWQNLIKKYNNNQTLWPSGRVFGDSLEEDFIK